MTTSAAASAAAAVRVLGPEAASAAAAAKMDPLDAVLLVTLLGGEAEEDCSAILERCAPLVVTEGGDPYCLFERMMHPAGAARWDAFCAAAERSVRGDDPNDPVAAAAAEASAATQRSGVFGRCRRCGSKRLLVTTKQLRRADEGQAVFI